MVTGELAAGEVERVYRETGGRLWRAVLLFSGSPDVADDAVAEAFAQLLRRAGGVRSAERWVWATAFRVARGLLADRRSLSPRLPEPGYQMEAAVHELTGALQALSPAQRAAVILHYYADRPIKEVAATLGTSSAAVGVHLHRARRKLKALLEDADG